MIENLVIRKYQSTDRESCRSLWRELTEWHREIYQDPTIGGTNLEDHFDEHLAKVGAERIWVAVIDSQVKGFIGLIFDKEEAEIEPLIVSKLYRNQGVGTRLIETVITEVKKLGVKFLNSKPVARNLEIIKLLHKLGFRNIGHIQLFIDFSTKQWKKELTLFDLQFNY